MERQTNYSLLITISIYIVTDSESTYRAPQPFMSICVGGSGRSLTVRAAVAESLSSPSTLALQVYSPVSETVTYNNTPSILHTTFSLRNGSNIVVVCYL